LNIKPPSERLSFDLEDSPVPEEWKKRIADKLNNIPEVFTVDLPMDVLLQSNII
jgi:hypothetical protein